MKKRKSQRPFLIQTMKTIQLNKHECRGLYGKLLIRMQEVLNSTKVSDRSSFIPLSYFYEKLGRNFAIKKYEIRELLSFLHDVGFIQLSCAGVKSHYKIKEVVE